MNIGRFMRPIPNKMKGELTDGREKHVWRKGKFTHFRTSVDERLRQTIGHAIDSEIHSADDCESIIDMDSISFVGKFCLAIEYALQKPQTIER